MKKLNKFTKIIIPIFIVTLVIIGIKQLMPKSKAEETTETFGENIGYGYINVTYNSNYVGDNENTSYVIKHPIAIDAEGKKYITAGEDKFDEKFIVIKDENDNLEEYKNTGFRGYTLTNKNTRNILG